MVVPPSSSAIYASSWQLAFRRKGRRWQPICTRGRRTYVWVSMKSSIFFTLVQHFLFSRTWCCGSTHPFLQAWGQRCGTPCGFLPPLAHPPLSCMLLSADHGCWECTTRNSSWNKRTKEPLTLIVWHIWQYSSQKCNLTGFLGSSTSRILRFSNGMMPRGSLSWINEGIKIEHGYQLCIQN